MPPSMQRDIASAYLLTAARVGSWIIVSALVFRTLGPLAFAMFALGRSTVGLLAYTALGIGPAMTRLIAEAKARPLPIEKAPAHPILNYQTVDLTSVSVTYSSGMALSLYLGLIGCAFATLYSFYYAKIHVVPLELIENTRIFVFCMGLGVVLRMVSDASGAILQTHGGIFIDNCLQSATEIIWTCACFSMLWAVENGLAIVGMMFMVMSIGLWIARAGMARRLVGDPKLSRSQWPIIKRLMIFGGLVMFSQSAEFLYAPVDYIIINRLLAPAVVADYAPALQIDGALLLLVTAVGAVLLPKAALAHTTGDLARVRYYYLYGTLLTSAVLVIAAGATILLSKSIFHLWLNNDMPVTRLILPAVMLHTVMGGSSAVGRSILIGMGKVAPYTIAVLIAGVSNMLLAILFVTYFDWGLWGIVFATNIVVFIRAILWQPWYVLRALKTPPRRP